MGKLQMPLTTRCLAPNGGFTNWVFGSSSSFFFLRYRCRSSGSPDLIHRPVVATRAFAPPAVNANDQDRDPASLLNWMMRLIRRRRESTEIGFGTCRPLAVAPAAVVTLRHDLGPSSLLTIHNLSA